MSHFSHFLGSVARMSCLVMKGDQKLAIAYPTVATLRVSLCPEKAWRGVGC